MAILNTLTENTPKNAKHYNLRKIKKILKSKYKLSGCPVFTFSLPGREFAPLTPRQLCHCKKTLEILIKQKLMFTMLVIVDKHQHFECFISQMTSIRLEVLSSNAVKSFVSN